MRLLFRTRLGCVVGLAVLMGSAAWAAPDFPAGSEALERQLLAKLDADTQAWIKEQARTVVSSGRISEGRARVLALGEHVAGADVNALSFLLLMQAVRDSDADLEAVMSNSQANYAEQDELSKITGAQGTTSSPLSSGARTALSQRAPTRSVLTVRSGQAVAGPNLAPSADADLSVHLDLQTAMERESQAEDAVASAMKRLPPAGTSVH